MRLFMVGWAVFLLLAGGSLGVPCQFCCFAKTPALSHELTTMDIVAVAMSVSALPPDTETGVAYAQFEIVEVLKGEMASLIGGRVKTACSLKAKAGDLVLLKKSGPPTHEWSQPLQLTPRAREYLRKLAALPDNPVERI